MSKLLELKYKKFMGMNSAPGTSNAEDIIPVEKSLDRVKRTYEGILDKVKILENNLKEMGLSTAQMQNITYLMMGIKHHADEGLEAANNLKDAE